MARPVKDYEAEEAAAIAELEFWLSNEDPWDPTFTAREVDALEVLLEQSVETVDLIDELRRAPKNL